MGQAENRIGNRRVTNTDGFLHTQSKRSEPKEFTKEIMGKQKVLDSSGDDRHVDTTRPVPTKRKWRNLVTFPYTLLKKIKEKSIKGIDNLKLFVYNVYCSIAKRKDKQMANDNNNTNKQSKSAKKTEKKAPNTFMSGIITIGIAAAWVSAAYCVVLVNTGTGDDMFPKYASLPLALVLAGTFLVAIYKTIKNNNR